MAGEKTKQKGLGCLSKLIILIVLLIVAVYVASKIFFPAERVRAEIVKRVSEQLGRTVELDEVSLSLLPAPSLDLRGLRIFNPEDFPGAEFVSIDRLVVDLKIMPLLRRQLVFSDIELVHPVIQLRKAVDGRVNYSFELETGGESIPTPLGPLEAVTSEEAALTVFAFDWAEIRNGDVIYIDDSAQSKTVLNNISLETRLHLDSDGKTGRSAGRAEFPSITSTLIPENIPLAIELAYNARIDFQHADLIFENTTLTVNGIPFDIEATVRNLLDPASIFASITAQGVALEPLVDYLPAVEGFDRKALRLQGKLDGRIEARIEIDSDRTPYLSGSLTLNDLTVGYQTVSSRVHFDALTVAFDADTVSFVSQGGQLAEEAFFLAGSVRTWDDPVFDLTARGQYALAGLVPFLEPAYNHSLSGTARFDVTVRGRQSQWLDTKILGTLAVDKGYYFNDSLTSPLERFDMLVSMTEKKVSIDSLYVEYPGVQATLTGTVRNGFAHLLEPRGGHKKPYLDFVLRSPLVNYDILVPEEEAADESAPGGEAGEIAAPILLPDIEAGGKVYIDTLVYSKIAFTNLTGEVGYKDGVITFRDARGDLYSGRVSGQGAVDITDMYRPRITCDFTGRDIEANDFMARFANLDGHLFGKVNLAGTLSGQGAEFEDFISSLSADGNIDMQQGRLINFDLIDRLAEQFKFKTFKEEQLRDLVSDVKIRDGRLLLENARVLSQMGDWDITGTVAFLEKNLDLYMSVYLSPEYSKDIDLFGGLLQDDKGRVKLGFNLGGTYTKPTVSNISTDNSIIKEKAADKLKKEADNLLKKLFKKN